MQIKGCLPLFWPCLALLRVAKIALYGAGLIHRSISMRNQTKAIFSQKPNKKIKCGVGASVGQGRSLLISKRTTCSLRRTVRGAHYLACGPRDICGFVNFWGWAGQGGGLRVCSLLGTSESHHPPTCQWGPEVPLKRVNYLKWRS